MANQNEVLEAALNELRKRREQMNHAIEALEAELGVSTGGAASSISGETKPISGKTVEANDLLRMIYEGQFFGKSQTQAAKDLLNIVRRPLKTSMIVDAFHKAGMTVYAPSLYMSFKRSSDFVLVLPNTWGLKEWYPEGKKNSKAGKKPKRGKRRQRRQRRQKTADMSKEAENKNWNDIARPKKKQGSSFEKEKQGVKNVMKKLRPSW